MSDERIDAGRFFLKDTIRKQVDFRGTAQSRGLSGPPVQKPVADGLERIDLPPAAKARKLGGVPLGAAIARRISRRQYKPDAVNLEELAWLLWACQGVRRRLSPECALRTVPSAGARHAFETYLAVSAVRGCRQGLYRFLPFDWQLCRLAEREDLADELAAACFGQSFVSQAAVTMVWTALPERMEWRYGAAAHKVIAIDVGHVCQNLYLACEAVACGTCAIAAYDQHAVDKLLGVDGVDEFAIYLASIGKV